MSLLDRYESNKKLWEIYSAKEVKQLAAEIKKEIDKVKRESDSWRSKISDRMNLVEKQRIDAQIRKRQERKKSLEGIFHNINQQIKDWFK